MLDQGPSSVSPSWTIFHSDVSKLHTAGYDARDIKKMINSGATKQKFKVLLREVLEIIALIDKG